MVLTLLYARRAFYDPDPEYRRDTLELLKRGHVPVGKNSADALRKNAFKVTRNLHADQMALMDPVLRNHLRVGTTSRRFKPPE
jgi:hypothetical protein